MRPPLLDAHLHLWTADRLDLPSYREHDAESITLALNSVNEQEWPHIITCAKGSAVVKPFIGIHPWWSAETDPGWQERLVKLIRQTNCGIGEIGLDALAGPSAAIQESVFVPQLEIAEQLGRVVTIHCCRRWGRLIDLLAGTCKGRQAIVIIHGFSGSVETMRRLLDLGALLSFGPALLNPARIKIREAFEKAPLDRILLETDWPPPSGGKSNGPAIRGDTHHAVLEAIYRAAAELKAVDIDELRHTLWSNGQIFTH